MAYSIVAACVLLLRYEVDDFERDELALNDFSLCSKLFNTMSLTEPTRFSSALVTVLVTLYAILCAWMSMVISKLGNEILAADKLAVTLLLVPIALIILVMIMINRQPQSSKELTFKAPFNPWFPALSIMINIHLMVELDVATWIRFLIWVTIGLVIYFGYSRRRRNEILMESE